MTHRKITQSRLPHNHGEHIENILEHMPETEDFQTVSDIFKQLGDSSRIRIFWLLCHCEECVMNISAIVDMTSPAVSHHLKILKSSGLVVSRRTGKEVYYKAAKTEAAQLLHHMIEQLVTITCPTGYDEGDMMGRPVRQDVLAHGTHPAQEGRAANIHKIPDTPRASSETAGREPQETAGAEPQETAGREPQDTVGREPQDTVGREMQAVAGREPQETAGRESQAVAGREPQETAGRESQETAGRDPQETVGRELQETAGRELHVTAGTTSQVMAGAEPPETVGTDQEETIVEIHDYLTNHLSQRVTIDELAREYLINSSTLKSVFKKTYGKPLAAYMKEYRLRYAAELLRTTDDSIAAIAAKIGYESQSKFTKAFKELYQMTPRQYRKSGCGNEH